MSSIKLRTDVRLAVEHGHSVSQVLDLFWSAHGGVVYPPIDYFRSLLLCAAVYYKRKHLVTALLEERFPVNYNGGYGSMRPLHIACHLADKTMIEELIECGADVNLKGAGEIERIDLVGTAADHLLCHDDINLMNLVYEQYDPRQNNGKSILHVACERNAVKCVQHLLTQVSALDINATDYSGLTPLHLASSVNPFLVDLLVCHGASVTASKPVLLEATYPYKHSNPHFLPKDIDIIVKALLDHGENINCCNDEGTDTLCMLLYQIKLSIQQDFVSRDRLVENHASIIKTIKVLLDRNINVDWYNIVLQIKQEMCSLGNVFDQKKYSNDEGISAAFHALLEGVKFVRDIIFLIINSRPSVSDATGLLFHTEVLSTLPDVQKAIIWFKGDWDHLVGIFKELFLFLLLRFGQIEIETVAIQQMCKKWPTNKPLISMYLQTSSHKVYNNVITYLTAYSSSKYSETEALMKYVYNTGSNPRTLKELCSVTIFNQIDTPKASSVQTLHFPSSLKKYILLQT